MSFMSIYVLQMGDPKHSPINDLESLLWVLLWVIGRKAIDASHKDEIAKDFIRNRFMDSMSSDIRMTSAAELKYKLLLAIPGHFKGPDLPWLEPFKDLLLSLSLIALEYHNLSKNRHNDQGVIFNEQEILAAFDKYLHVFQTNRPTKETWDYLADIRNVI